MEHSIGCDSHYSAYPTLLTRFCSQFREVLQLCWNAKFSYTDNLNRWLTHSTYKTSSNLIQIWYYWLSSGMASLLLHHCSIHAWCLKNQTNHSCLSCHLHLQSISHDRREHCFDRSAFRKKEKKKSSIQVPQDWLLTYMGNCSANILKYYSWLILVFKQSINKN